MQARRRRWIGLAGHQPGGPMVGIAVPTRIDGDDVEQDGVEVGRLGGFEGTGEGDANGGKHSSGIERKYKKSLNYL